MTMTQLLLLAVCLLGIELLVGMFGILVFGYKIDKAFEELRDFPLPPECSYRENKTKVVKNEKRN